MARALRRGLKNYVISHYKNTMSELHPFIFEGLPVRGAMVRITDDWQELLARRSYPPIVQRLLGDMTAAAVLLQHNVSFHGSLILQIVGSEGRDASPVKLAVVEVAADLAFRATAKLVHEVSGLETLGELINAGHHARCVITLDTASKANGQQPYQSVVPLQDVHKKSLQSIAEVLEHYMRQSEQLDTKFVLASSAKMAVGILIQRMPRKGAGNLAGENDSTGSLGANEDFNRIALLAASMKPGELLTLSVDDSLHRLFWNEPIVRYTAVDSAPKFHCTCSRERVAAMLKNLEQTQAEQMADEKDGISVHCDFCGKLYRFEPTDAQ